MFEANDPKLTAYVLGELSDAERAEVEAALAESAELRQAVDEIHATCGLLEDAFAAESCPALHDQQRARVLAESNGHAGSDPIQSSEPSVQPTVEVPHKKMSRRRLVSYVTAASLLIAIVSAAAVVKLAGRDERPMADARLHGANDPAAELDPAVWADYQLGSEEEMSEMEAVEGDDWARARYAANGSNDYTYTQDRWDGLRDHQSTTPSSSGTPQIVAELGEIEIKQTLPAVEVDIELSGQGRSLGNRLSASGSQRHATRSPAERLPSQSGQSSSGAAGGFDEHAGEKLDRPTATRPATQPKSRPRPANPTPADPATGRPTSATNPAQERTPGPRTYDAKPADQKSNEQPSDRPGTTYGPTGVVNRPQPDAPPFPNDDPVTYPTAPRLTKAPSVNRLFDGQTNAPSSGRKGGQSAGSGDASKLGDKPGEDGGVSVSRLRERIVKLEKIENREKTLPSGGKEDARTELARREMRRILADKESADEGKPGDDDPADVKDSAPRRTWRRARATPNASRLVIGDHDELLPEGVQVNVQVDGFRARVLLDWYFFNNRNQQLEGSFKLRLPDEASLYYFAFGETTFEYRPMVDNLAGKGFLSADLIRAAGTRPEEIFMSRSDTWDKVKVARIVPREKAAHAYSETVRRRVDPALVEWAGAGVFNAKVYPLMPNKLHRIVIGYDVNLNRDGDSLVYHLDLPDDLQECMVDLNVAAIPGSEAEVTPKEQPFVAGGRAYFHFQNPRERTFGVRIRQPGSVLLAGADGEAGDYFATRFTPRLDANQAVAGSKQAVFLLDTSLSSNPDKFNVWLKLLEATLEDNRDTIRQFAVLTFNIESHWWKEGYTKNSADNVKALLNDCNTLSLEGATDLGAALREATSPAWPKDEQKASARPDLFLLSDGAATWGDVELGRIAALLKQRESGPLFAYKTGMTGTATGALEYLARETGGAVFSVTGEAEVHAAAIAHRRRPWRLVDVSVTGGRDLLIAGRPEWIYPGQRLIATGRGQPGIDADVMMTVRQGDREVTVRTPVDRVVASDLTPRIYGQVAVGQLEDLLGEAEDVATAYARHFRVSGRTCSLLMLESEADYQRFNIRPEDDLFVVKSSSAGDVVEKKLRLAADQLADPKQAMLARLSRLEQMPGFEFKVPTALKLALDRMSSDAFAVEVPRLVSKERKRSALPKPYFAALRARELDYIKVTDESSRRRKQHGAADALVALSNLVEQNPGDDVLARDVAFSALELGLPAQAYPLLDRVAAARPYQPQVYQALAQSLAAMGRADLAMVYYEVAMAGKWHSRYPDFHQIAAAEYRHLLRRIAAGELQSSVPEFAKARLESSSDAGLFKRADLVITMMWSTDRTDVDMHVVEPSGEVCNYQHRNTRSGATLTRDVTQGFGPEMYVARNAKHGKYAIKAKYFRSDANRTGVRTKVYVTVYENFGDKRERVSRHVVTLEGGSDEQQIATVMVEK